MNMTAIARHSTIHLLGSLCTSKWYSNNQCTMYIESFTNEKKKKKNYFYCKRTRNNTV